MYNLRLKFNSAKHVEEFIGVLTKHGIVGDLGSGRVFVDARSILGILSLDLSKPVQLNIVDIRHKVETDPIEELHRFVY